MFNLSKKTVVKTPAMKISEAQQKVQDAFIMFSLASDELVQANKILKESIEENELNKKELTKKMLKVANEIEKSQSEILANNELKAKLELFIPKKKGE